MINLPKYPLLLLALAGGAITSLEAQSLNWNNPAGGIFHESENWNPATTPTASNPVTFTAADADYTITLQADQQVSTFTQTAGSIEFDLNNHALTASEIILDASNGAGSTIFRNGSITLAKNIEGGYNGSSVRNVTFSNVTVSGGTNWATMLAPGNTGSRSNLRITLTDATEMLVYATTVGTSNEANGNQLTVTGAGTRLESRFMQIGVNNGSTTVSTNNHFLLTGGDVVIQNADTYNIQYFLVQGAGNTATLSGGNLSVTNSLGTAYIRTQREGAITVNGAAVRTNRVWRASGDPGIAFHSGVVETEQTSYEAQTLTVGDGGEAKAIYRFMDKMAGVTGSGEHTGNFEIATNGELQGNGKVIGNVTNAGVIDAGLGDDVGELEIVGNLTLESDSLVKFTLAGLTDYDQLTVSNAIVFDGILQVTVDSFSVNLDDQFQLFTAGSFSGNFSGFDFSGAQLDPGLFWAFDAETGVLQAIPEPQSLLFLAAGGAMLIAARFRKKSV